MNQPNKKKQDSLNLLSFAILGCFLLFLLENIYESDLLISAYAHGNLDRFQRQPETINIC